MGGKELFLFQNKLLCHTVVPEQSGSQKPLTPTPSIIGTDLLGDRGDPGSLFCINNLHFFVWVNGTENKNQKLPIWTGGSTRTVRTRVANRSGTSWVPFTPYESPEYATVLFSPLLPSKGPRTVYQSLREEVLPLLLLSNS